MLRHLCWSLRALLAASLRHTEGVWLPCLGAALAQSAPKPDAATALAQPQLQCTPTYFTVSVATRGAAVGTSASVLSSARSVLLPQAPRFGVMQGHKQSTQAKDAEPGTSGRSYDSDRAAEADSVYEVSEPASFLAVPPLQPQPPWEQRFCHNVLCTRG
jgi:hypothetical protein